MILILGHCVIVFTTAFNDQTHISSFTFPTGFDNSTRYTSGPAVALCVNLYANV